MSEAMDPIVRIGKRLQELAAAEGLELHTFAVLPNFEEGPHMVQAMFVLTDEAAEAATAPEAPQTADDRLAGTDVELSDEERRMFEQLEWNVKQDTKAEEASKVADSLKSMLDNLEGGKGLLD